MRTRSKHDAVRLFATVLIAGFMTLNVAPAEGAGQRTFPSADAAVKALIDAAKAGDADTLIAIFGPEGRDIVQSGDPVADQAARDSFSERASARTHLEPVGDDFAALSVGEDYWPFPLPLVKDEGGWSFDTAAGKTELLNRRIGRNELNTIHSCQEYGNAQREYGRWQQAQTGVIEYAQRIRSTPGERDGLYWEPAAGEEESPIGPRVAMASREGYSFKDGSGGPQPFHGYIYKILTAGGRHAPGGAKSYIKDGRMTEGFALLAYPAGYGTSGIMTFQVNQQGIVFQKDLGARTAEISKAISAYDPDDSWEPTE